MSIVIIYILDIFYFISSKRKKEKENLLQSQERGSESENRRFTEHGLRHRDLHGRIVVHEYRATIFESE